MSLMSEPMVFPRMARARQHFDVPPAIDARETTRREMAPLAKRIKRGTEIAVAVGSRGITNIRPIVEAVVAEVRNGGASPFIVPAMGSHGGATPEGQVEVLAEYGVSEKTLGVPVRASMDTQPIGAT